MDLRLLFTTLGPLFVAELGYKTRLAVIVMTARNGKPIPVLIGAVIGLALVTVLGVVVGGFITRFVPVKYVSKGAAVAFIVIGVLMLSGEFQGPAGSPHAIGRISKIKVLPAW